MSFFERDTDRGEVSLLAWLSGLLIIQEVFSELLEDLS